MLHPPRPDVEQREQQQTQPRPAVVAAEVGARAAQSGIQAEPADIAVEQLEPAVRRQLLRHELDRQISLDHLPQAAYAQTHQRGLRERKSDRSEEHTSELQSHSDLVCRLLLEKKNQK